MSTGYDVDPAPLTQMRQHFGTPGERIPYRFDRQCAIGALRHQPESFNDRLDRVFVFVDAPYLHNTRRSNHRYNHELTEAQHEELLLLLVQLDCDVAITHYPCPMYDDALADWRKVEFTTTDRAGNVRQERLYCNYDKPVVLHDHRYLGSDRDHRQRIKRKIQRNVNLLMTNWTTQERAGLLLELSKHLTTPEAQLLATALQE